MKATITIGSMTVELDGEPVEISNVISRQVDWHDAAAKQIVSGDVKLTGKGVKRKKAKKRSRKGERQPWTDIQVEKLIKNQATKSYSELAKITGHPESAVATKLVQLRNDRTIK